MRWCASVVPRVPNPPHKPLLVYDGDCGFCASRVKRWRRFIGEAVDFMALQEERVAEKLPDLSRTQLTQAVHLIEPDGSICCGAEAVFRLLAFKNRLPLWLYRRVPGFAQCAAFFYRLVARHRSALR